MSDPDDDFDMNVVPATKSTGTSAGGDEFDFEVEMWDDAPFNDGPSTSGDPTNPVANPTKFSAKLSAPSLNQGEDQDMWDIADELQAQVKSTDPLEGPPVPVDDDDWDSMYA
jgi:hypothetical protein